MLVSHLRCQNRNQLHVYFCYKQKDTGPGFAGTFSILSHVRVSIIKSTQTWAGRETWANHAITVNLQCLKDALVFGHYVSHSQNPQTEQWWDKKVNPDPAFLRETQCVPQRVVLTERLFIVQCFCSFKKVLGNLKERKILKRFLDREESVKSWPLSTPLQLSGWR